MSNLNISALKKHALACSVARKNGRFTRVGQDFIDEVEADVEAIVRKALIIGYLTESSVKAEDAFVTGALADRLKGVLNTVVAQVIEHKVARQPSVGVTLGRTR